MSRNFDTELIPLPLCHTKMGVLPTPSYRVSQSTYSPPPTCMTLFMNAPIEQFLVRVWILAENFESKIVR